MKNNTIVTLWPAGSYSHTTAKNILRHDSDLTIDLVSTPWELIQNIKNIAGNMMAGSLWNMSVIEKIPQAIAWVIPLHNTYGRTVNLMPEGIYALAKQHPHTQIIGWYHLQVCHILAGLPWVKIENITSIHSHPQALSQCLDAGIKRLWNTFSLKSESSTTAHIPHLTHNQAVICSEDAAIKNGLEILDKNFGPENNITDFAIITTQQDYNTEIFQNLTKNKTLAILTLQNQPKSLANALSTLWDHGVDMNSLHSQMSKPGEIDFIIVANNHINWEHSNNDLEKIKGKVQVL